MKKRYFVQHGGTNTQISETEHRRLVVECNDPKRKERVSEIGALIVAGPPRDS